jgi:ribonuclease BN (tRNA processing enzyme)
MFKVYDADRECGCRGGISMNSVSGPECRTATGRVRRCGSRWSAWRSLAAAACLALAISPKAFAVCSAPVAVQVLGSGGPDSNDARASSGYLLWLDGEARLLVDAGGGIFLRFGEAKARFESLDAVAITHLHADHVSDLPALLKSGFFGDRQRPLPIVGPSGGDVFPGIKEFMHALFDPERGAFRYLSGYLDGSGGMVRADIVEMDAAAETPKAAFGNDRFKLTAVGVKHGPVPALGYLVEVRGRRIAFAGDQNGDNPAFATMIKGVDILIMDHAVPEMADPVARQLHARPSEIGLLAAQAGVKQLVLSHNMARSLGPLKENLALIRQHYDGPTKVAEDLMCFD